MGHRNVSNRYKTFTSSILDTTFQGAAVYSGDSAFDPCAKAKRASHEIRKGISRRPQDLDVEIADKHFLPEDAQLHLSEPRAEAAMRSHSEGNVLPGIGTIDL